MKNYYTLLREQARQHPKKLCLRIDSLQLTYDAVLKETDHMAAGLPREMNGAVLVLADDFKNQFLSFFALQKQGICPILLHHGLSGEEQQAILEDNHLQGLLIIQGNELSFQATGSTGAGKGEGDILGVLSSGSEGTPKVMYRTYDSWAGFFPVQNPIFGVDDRTVMFLHGSLSFTGNLNSLLSAVFAGGSIVTSAYLRCRRWEQLIRDTGTNVLYLVPTKLRLLCDTISQPLPTISHLFTGSQLLAARDIAALLKCLPAAELVLYYGASELNYITYTICDSPDRDVRNLGKPFPGIGIEIRDGLIYVDTAYHVSGAEIPFAVGDAGYWSPDGDLMFEGRSGGYINKGGVKLNAAHIENLLRGLPEIKDAVVISYEDERRGSDIAAFLVRSASAKEKEVRETVRKTLKPVEVPSVIRFLDQLPLNDRGKIDRKQLRKLL